MAEDRPDRPESVRETLEAAVEAVEASRPPPPPRPARPPRDLSPSEPVRTDPSETQQAESESETERDQSEPDSGERAEREGRGRAEREESWRSAPDRPRDQFGRFISGTPEARPPERGAPAQTQPEAEAHETTDQPEQAEAEPAGAPALLPPNAWSAPAKETWNRLPRAIQEEVDRRERDFQRHFQERAQQVNVLEPIAQAIAPYQQKLALRGINPAAAIQQLLSVQDMLDTDPIQGVAYVARSYGVDLRNFATAFQQAQQPQDPAVRELAERVARQDQMLNSWRQGAEQQEMSRISSEVQAFAADSRSHPYFEYVRERMAQLMQSGATQTLEQAYRLACADNEDVSRAMRQAQESVQRAQRSQAERQAADRARKAAVSVSGTPYGGSPSPNGRARDGTVRDSVLAAMEEVATR